LRSHLHSGHFVFSRGGFGYLFGKATGVAMTELDAIAIEAADRAYEETRPHKPSNFSMRHALTAYFASLRERGMMRDGVSVELGGEWSAFSDEEATNPKIDFPVIIIRMGEK